MCHVEIVDRVVDLPHVLRASILAIFILVLVRVM